MAVLAVAGAVALSAAIFAATGGRMLVFVLPLLFGLPFLFRSRR